MPNFNARELVNAAYNQATGKSDLETLLTSQAVDGGTLSDIFQTVREPFTKALIEQCAKFMYTDSSYAATYSDPFFTDSRRFGSIVQLISVEMPEVHDSPAWRAYESGVTTVGNYTVYLPIVTSKLYNKVDAWALDITITNEQWDDAMRSIEELESFTDYIFLCVENKLLQHRENMNSVNRNNFIAEKILAQNAEDNRGVHVVNLLELYNTERGGNIQTPAQFLASAEAMRFASKTLALYSEYLRKQSALFNTSGKVKFVPSDRLVLEVNSAFEKAMDEVALSTVYHDEMVKLPGYHSVPYWQAERTEDGALDFAAVTSIDVTTDSGTVSQSGIVALLADKYCILHTIRGQRTAAQPFEIENIVLYSFQNRDSYLNNLDNSAVVFTIEANTR